jgi:hypothetical protein
MSTHATELERTIRRSPRAAAVSALGPLTVLGGVVWTVVQPYRLTFLHPGEHDFWSLVVVPPVLVVLVGALFHLVVLPGLLEDLSEAEER